MEDLGHTQFIDEMIMLRHLLEGARACAWLYVSIVREEEISKKEADEK